MPSVQFERWECPFPTSAAYRTFARDHTHLNEHYWSLAPAIHHAGVVARQHSAATLTADVFSHHEHIRRKLPRTLEDWQSTLEEASNWIRLSATMSLCAYLEAYMKTAASLAIYSDPNAHLGFPRAIDGIKLLKMGQRSDVFKIVSKVVSGSWSARISAYEKLFGRVPGEVRKREGELQKLQKKRNSIAHMFGRNDLKEPTLVLLAKETRLRVEESTLLEWLNLADTIARAVDDHLRSTHIGGYELLHYYHYWPERSSGSDIKREAGRFSSAIGGARGATPGQPYLAGAIQHYRDS